MLRIIFLLQLRIAVFLLELQRCPCGELGAPVGTSLPFSQLEKRDWNHVYSISGKEVRNTRGVEKEDSQS